MTSNCCEAIKREQTKQREKHNSMKYWTPIHHHHQHCGRRPSRRRHVIVAAAVAKGNKHKRKLLKLRRSTVVVAAANGKTPRRMEAMDEIAGYLTPASDNESHAAPIPVTAATAANVTAATTDSEEGSGESKTSSSSSPAKPFIKRPTSAAQTAAPAPVPAAASMVKQVPAVEVDLNTYKFIPLRLTEEERRMLNVLVNALEVCEYTDVVDVTFSHTRKSKYSRIIESLVDILSISSGLMLANNLTKGENLVAGKSLTDNVPFFTDLFEIGRRYKIMNPAKMRNTYGKLMYILMDTESYNVKNELKLSFIKPIVTVYSYLAERERVEILQDPLWQVAAMAIVSGGDSEGGGSMSKRELAILQAKKQQATETLVKKYTSEDLSAEEVRRLIDSIADNVAYLEYNAKPVERMLQILTQSFDPTRPQDPFSLQLTTRPTSFMGSGSCLSHSHATQYRFVLQSLTLWKEIMSRMPRLWMLADSDMIHEAYRLVDTGQGYQRLQACPRVRKAMSNILGHVQSQVGQWVGLSVVHLGDRDVPNALVFIDKYTQVPRILSPIAQCIELLPNLVEDRAFHAYVRDEWGSIEGLRMQILSDFFKHGFDGSGDDGGSCIDGRLTSAWNWCSQLHKKPYYHVFMFTGFQGFDGDFKDSI